MRSIVTSSHVATRSLRGLAATIGMLCLTACGSGYSSPTPTTPGVPTGPTDVTVANNSFTPANLSVTSGNAVTWTWNTCSGGDGYGGGQTCVNHDIVFDDGTTSGTLSQGSYQRKFTTAGTYAYHCSIHGAAMSGKVVVQ
jgi:plastocyanin